MFKRFIIFVSVLLIASIFTISSALAITIGVNPPLQDVPLGDSFNISIDISGLGDFSPDSLSIFDLDLDFDNSILSFNNAAFGDPILGDQLDIFGLGTITDIYVIPGVGRVNLFELSLDLPGDLDSMQAGSFTLATVTFDTLALGTSQINLAINTLGDSYGSPLIVDPVENATVNVVPEPATFVLLLIGIIGVAWIKEKI